MLKGSTGNWNALLAKSESEKRSVTLGNLNVEISIFQFYSDKAIFRSNLHQNQLLRQHLELAFCQSVVQMLVVQDRCRPPSFLVLGNNGCRNRSTKDTSSIALFSKSIKDLPQNRILLYIYYSGKHSVEARCIALKLEGILYPLVANCKSIQL